jgi:hypothetical protein
MYTSARTYTFIYIHNVYLCTIHDMQIYIVSMLHIYVYIFCINKLAVGKSNDL